jgi:CRP-like cAMP-binding protein
MADRSVSADLHTVLEQNCGRIRKSRNTTLFRRGEKAFGVFVILSGVVRLDFGVDCPLSRSYGPGALLGVPATVTNRNYSMTATVTEDAELGFWSPGTLHALLSGNPELCQQLLVLMSQRVAENSEILKALHDRQPELSLHSSLI